MQEHASLRPVVGQAGLRSTFQQRRQDPPHLAAGKGRYTLHPFDRKEERKQSPTAKTVVSPPRLWISKEAGRKKLIPE
ncbi:hypothetical protein E2320_001238, partial [Naja naja]